MNILHIGLASNFTENMLYQDNILSDLNAKAGHKVTYISNTYVYKDGVLVQTEECDKILDNGVRLIRINYDWVINDFITRKIQKAKKIESYLAAIKPDSILFHGIVGYELLDVAKYVKEKKIPFYVDSHATFKNTAKTPIAKMAYKYINGFFLKKSLPYIKKILYIGMLERNFLKEMYQIPDGVMEDFPLGGILMGKNEQLKCRETIINKFHFPKDAIIFAHSGKLDILKNTKAVLEAFSSVKDDRFRLLIYGSIPENMKPTLLPLIAKDDRIRFLGWKKADEQNEILGACDLYLQPGSASASAQAALCSGCALLINSLSYDDDFKDSVFYENTAFGIEKILKEISKNQEILITMKNMGGRLAEKKFDYNKIATRYLE